MINVEQALKHYDISTKSCSGVVAGVRGLIETKDESKQLKATEDLIYHVFGVHTKISDRVVARIALQYAVAEVCKTNFECEDAQELLDTCIKKAERYKADPRNAWMFATGETESSFKPSSTARKPAAKTKGELAMELYDKHVVNAKKPLTNMEFVELLVKDLGMTKSGARTYAYNCKAAAAKKEGK